MQVSIRNKLRDGSDGLCKGEKTGERKTSSVLLVKPYSILSIGKLELYGPSNRCVLVLLFSCSADSESPLTTGLLCQ